jgi:hypothetical protein
MSDQWMLRGKEFANCNCDYGCPCQFGAPSTYGTCEAVAGMIIEEAYFNDIKLDGLSLVMLLQWPGEIAEGNGKEQIIIGDDASEEQRIALEKIAKGESTAPGATHFYVFSTTMSEVLETLYLPVDLSIDVEGRTASMHVDGMIKSSGKPIKDAFSGEDVRAGIHLPGGFEYTYAEMASGTSTVSGEIKMDLDESYGQFAEMHMNQDGVIRQ